MYEARCVEQSVIGAEDRAIYMETFVTLIAVIILSYDKDNEDER